MCFLCTKIVGNEQIISVIVRYRKWPPLQGYIKNSFELWLLTRVPRLGSTCVTTALFPNIGNARTIVSLARAARQVNMAARE